MSIGRALAGAALGLMCGGVLLPSIGAQADGEAWRETELARERFEDAGWRERWVVEGEAETTAAGGRLRVVSQQATLWWRQALPADVAIELTAGVEGPAEGNAANLNLIFHAREADGSPYRFGRSARYDEYHAIPNYIATLTGGFQEGWARLRRNPGFTLLSEERSTRSEVGRTYRIRVAVTGGRIRYWLDGRLVHDARDPQPLPGGHFALRTWRSRVWWSNLRFAALTPPGGSDRGQTGVGPGSDRGRTRVRSDSDRGRIGVGPDSDRGQIGVGPGSHRSRTGVGQGSDHAPTRV